MFVNNKPAGQTTIRTDNGEFVTQTFELPAASAGSMITVRLEFHAGGGDGFHLALHRVAAGLELIGPRRLREQRGNDRSRCDQRRESPL
jgi:hypothetical protein